MVYYPLLPLEICKKLKTFPCSLTPPQIATIEQFNIPFILDFLPQEFRNADIKLITQEKLDQILKSQERLENIEEICQCIAQDEDLAIQKLLYYFLSQAIELNASDIHFQTLQEYVDVKVRIDGDLREFSVLPLEYFSLLSSFIKLECLLDIHEIRKPQDGKFSTNFEGRDFDFRVSTIPTIKGESLVIRILYKDTKEKTLQELGFSHQIQQILHAPYGLILVTGPTGSGKSTTLYSMLHALKDSSKKIITIEDPVEYDVKELTQIAINEKYGFGFQEALRSILRQDPDMIMVGETRDEETLSLLIRASLTGHLVFSTLHTNDALSTIQRLSDMRAKPYLIASLLHLIISQRLLPKLCPHCKTSLRVSNLPDKYKDCTFYTSKGCNKCNHKGYSGRILIYESLIIDEKLRELIHNHAPREKFTSYLKEKQFQTLFDHALQKSLNGELCIKEALHFYEDTL
ncbi:type II/IV secretion system protein [Helicobacter cholecystus]|uniref:Type II/IV secretion system protein n=1 Tax=Helicobacter cholecystus TaxID=45498 RepID=A0A3D8ITB5_9HELI|nr:GspE/PulE family protein [Helicobacter cholecystus]RDU68145.1 type II/IV secretion system protein [Helicobacter cholecystus]VEJ24525.1 type II protein secretion system E protein [Helicobacter cholecystus]